MEENVHVMFDETDGVNSSNTSDDANLEELFKISEMSMGMIMI